MFSMAFCSLQTVVCFISKWDKWIHYIFITLSLVPYFGYLDQLPDAARIFYFWFININLSFNCNGWPTFYHSTRSFKSIKFKLFPSKAGKWWARRRRRRKNARARQSNEIFRCHNSFVTYKRSSRNRIAANPTSFSECLLVVFFFFWQGRLISKFLALHCQLSKAHCVRLTMKMSQDWHACRRRRIKKTYKAIAIVFIIHHPMVLIFNCFINENRFILVGYAKDATELFIIIWDIVGWHIGFFSFRPWLFDLDVVYDFSTEFPFINRKKKKQRPRRDKAK